MHDMACTACSAPGSFDAWDQMRRSGGRSKRTFQCGAALRVAQLGVTEEAVRLCRLERGMASVHL